MSLSRLRKSSDFDRVLKGRGFQPRRKCSKISGGFSRWELKLSKRLFPQPV
jgi:hypothetical protein